MLNFQAALLHLVSLQLENRVESVHVLMLVGEQREGWCGIFIYHNVKKKIQKMH